MPSITSDILEGITRDTMLKVVGEDLGMSVVERDVDRTELYIADELFFCGTGAELTPIVSVDRVKIGDGRPGPLTKKIQTYYFDIVRGKNEKYEKWLTPTYGRQA
jgi:branched-chain amino acid aminotransferase